MDIRGHPWMSMNILGYPSDNDLDLRRELLVFKAPDLEAVHEFETLP